MEINKETKTAIIYENDVINGSFNYDKIRGYRFNRIFIPIELKGNEFILEHIYPSLYCMGKRLGDIYYYNNKE